MKRTYGGAVGALLTDLSETFDCLPHGLTAKVISYGVDIPSLKLLLPYLTKRKQWVKVNDIHSCSWSKIVFGIPGAPCLYHLYLTYFYST